MFDSLVDSAWFGWALLGLLLLVSAFHFGTRLKHKKVSRSQMIIEVVAVLVLAVIVLAFCVPNTTL